MDSRGIIHLKIFLLFFTATWLFAVNSTAQTNEKLTGEEMDSYRSDAEKLVSFLQFTVNTLGDPTVSVKEKDIIINQSYAKFFENEKVQIEDDLDESRALPINKDVQGYLQDIDFFFKQVQFKFTIEEIEQEINEKNQLFFKITVNRNLTGVTIDGKQVNTNRLRYIEINLNDEDKDLKIASIYTTKLNEKEELRKWWNDLSPVWKDLLGSNIALGDSIRMNNVLYYDDSVARLDKVTLKKMSRDTLSLMVYDSVEIVFNTSQTINAGLLDRQINKILQIDSINIAGSDEITNLKPLSRLTRLTRINCSNTPVANLMPLRNLTRLVHLNCSHCPVESIEPLRYLTNLEVLLLDDTKVKDLSSITNFVDLKKLHINHTPADSLDALAGLSNLKDLEFASTNIASLAPLQNCVSLERIDFSGTSVTDLWHIGGLKNIYFLKFEHTPVNSLKPLKDLSNLHYLFIDNTLVDDLEPLNGLPELNKIYCDNTLITRTKANAFMAQNPNVLVVYESSDLMNWWNSLPVVWKDIFNEKIKNSTKISKEELHEITRVEKIDISGSPAVNTLEPVTNLVLLSELNCQGTSITDLTPVKNLSDLTKLNFSNTKIKDISPLANLNKLTELRFDATEVESIEPLMELDELKWVYCDETKTEQAEVVKFMTKYPDCLVVYQTRSLERWWAGLPEVWKLLAEKFIKTDQKLSREQLQQLANLRRIDLADFPDMANQSLKIESLESVQKLIFLQELRFTNTRVTSLEPLRGLGTLEILVCPNNPIATLEPLSETRNLQVLDIQNTPVSNLEFLSTLEYLKKLNCSGTQIKNLKGVELITSLETLDCYNTAIKSLSQVEQLENLKLLRCYNTKIPLRKIENFRKLRPDVEVVYY